MQSRDKYKESEGGCGAVRVSRDNMASHDKFRHNLARSN